MKHKTGILLTNTGTPDAPTTKAVRSYLREFLSDTRIVKIPRLIWLPILYLFILTFRPRKSAELYQNIWTPDGSPLRVIMNKVCMKLREKITTSTSNVYIEVGMNYGSPSIHNAMQKLHDEKIDKLIVLPLFPQYSNSTTASTFDHVIAELQKWPALPALTLHRDYATHPDYIAALANSVRTFWKEHGESEHLLISFHGLPKRFVKAGDPYPRQCEQTSRLLAESLRLANDKWTLCYQSQFGYDKWLQPSTQTLFRTLPKQGIHHADVICPGFSIDCLETLEEIALRGKESFLHSGGKQLRFIPSLNDSAQHIDFLSGLLTNT